MIGKRSLRLLLGLGLLLAWLGLPRVVEAHVGAPYPILVEEQVGPYVVSALTDPDVGVGTFIIEVVVEGEPVPPETVVTLWVVPEDGHAPESEGYPAVWEVTRDGERFIAKVPFDARGMWRVRLGVEGAVGQGEIPFQVNVTPPYPGGLMTVVCLLPFVGVGGLWLLGVLRSRKPASSGSGSE